MDHKKVDLSLIYKEDLTEEEFDNKLIANRYYKMLSDDYPFHSRQIKKTEDTLIELEEKMKGSTTTNFGDRFIDEYGEEFLYKIPASKDNRKSRGSELETLDEMIKVNKKLIIYHKSKMREIERVLDNIEAEYRNALLETHCKYLFPHGTRTQEDIARSMYISKKSLQRHLIKKVAEAYKMTLGAL